jgi:DNA-binding response OmpR family regulator
MASLDDLVIAGHTAEAWGSSPETGRARTAGQPGESMLLIAPQGKATEVCRAELARDGFVVAWEASPALGLANARESGITLIVVDVAGFRSQGVHAIRALRDEGNPATVLAITAADDVISAIEAIESGADGCTDQTCTARELAARLRALVRRHGTNPAGQAQATSWILGDLRVDPVARSVVRDRRPVLLSPREFDVLVALLRRRGRLVSCEELLHDVWRDQKHPVSHTVETVIFSLRHKLEEDPTRPHHIHTVRSGGYIIL